MIMCNLICEWLSPDALSTLIRILKFKVPPAAGDLRRQHHPPDRGFRHEGRVPEDRAVRRARRHLCRPDEGRPLILQSTS
ncbi:unnamed protein product [Plutella xylostella]|uniref:(diamondback moth) hypothetical protein n=1 Tax=Plutella xylostella TaxID=51655 RepID=A0A8S4EUC0_PLUXY|nr:unnamed protein product [Plutella xylostella]